MAKSLQSSQGAVFLLLFAGYASYYFCRSDLSVAMPLMIDELKRGGLSQSAAVIRVGTISSWGVLAYAIGKLFLGSLGDVWGGRRTFLLGLGGAVLFTLLFASSSVIWIWTLAWIGNRLLQSLGWGSAVKICSKWFSYATHGTVLGALSVSFMIGDAVARQSMGALIQAGAAWRVLFYFAAGVGTLLFVVNLVWLRESRTDIGLAETEANPINLFHGRPEGASNGAGTLLRTLFSHRQFWIVCAVSFGCTLIRETFNIWTPTYLREFLGYSQAAAAGTSAIFPGVGAISVVVCGWLSDRLGVNGRALVMLVGLFAGALGLLVLTTIPAGMAGHLPVLVIGAVAFCVLGPYSYLGGAMALDFGGKQAGASSSGIIDGVGYIGALLAGDTVARLSVQFGWHGVFLFLTAVSLLSSIAAGTLLLPSRVAKQITAL